ncbi:hypothetical protein D3C84_491680 [compost metagenome]
MLTGERFTLGLHLIQLGMAGGDLGVLPGAGKQRQVEGELDAHHVTELAAAALVVDFPAPIGLLLRLGLAHPGLRLAGNGGEGRQLGMHLQLVGIARGGDRPGWQVAGQRLIGGGADPAAQGGAGCGLLTGQFILALSQVGRLLLGGNRIRGRCPSPGDLRPHGGRQQAVLPEKRLEQCLLALHGMEADPGQRGGLAHLQAYDAAFRFGALDGGLGHLRAGPALVTVGHFLHDPDHLHGHEVLVDGPAVGTAHGVVLHPKQQLRVGQLAGGNGGAAGGLQFRRLGRQRRGIVLGQAQGFIEGQVGGKARQSQHRRQQGGHNGPAGAIACGVHRHESCSFPLRRAQARTQVDRSAQAERQSTGNRNQARGGRQTPEGVRSGRKSLASVAAMGEARLLAGFTYITCRMLTVLHSRPGLHGSPWSDGPPISSQQSWSISTIIAMPAVFIGQGSEGDCTPAIPLRGSVKLIRRSRHSRR